MELDLSKIKKVHFIGIGGIGISAIARMMLLQGKKVSGSDRSQSIVTDLLVGLGAEIYFEHNENNLSDDANLVVYTIAISEDNPEFLKAKKMGIKTLSYPEMLGVVSKEKYTIAISGTHGKTTTTAMIGKMLIDLKLDPTVIVGSLIKGLSSNLIVGHGKYFVVEACEYRKSFLNINPKIIVITNIDNDHLDFYNDLADIEMAFGEFAGKLGKDDYLVCNMQDERILRAVKNIKCKIVDYSKNEIAPKLILKVIGKHNIENAKAAMSVAEILGLNLKKSAVSLESFGGTWRRFEYKGETKNGAEVYDDYGHHPTEVKATLRGAREFFPDRKIIVAFQPHLYSRTKLLLSDFSMSFYDADKVVISDIYAARETDDKTINSQILVDRINEHEKGKAEYVADLKDVEKYLKENSKKGDIIITMGAGSISGVSDKVTTHTPTID